MDWEREKKRKEGGVEKVSVVFQFVCAEEKETKTFPLSLSLSRFLLLLGQLVALLEVFRRVKWEASEGNKVLSFSSFFFAKGGGSRSKKRRRRLKEKKSFSLSLSLLFRSPLSSSLALALKHSPRFLSRANAMQRWAEAGCSKRRRGENEKAKANK